MRICKYTVHGFPLLLLIKYCPFFIANKIIKISNFKIPRNRQGLSYCKMGKTLAGKSHDHPDGRPDCIHKRGTNLSPSSARTGAGPRHQTLLYNQRPGQTQITQRPTSEADRGERAVPSLLTRESLGVQLDQPAGAEHQVK